MFYGFLNGIVTFFFIGNKAMLKRTVIQISKGNVDYDLVQTEATDTIITTILSKSKFIIMLESKSILITYCLKYINLQNPLIYRCTK